MPAGQLGWYEVFDEIKAKAKSTPVSVLDAACGFGGLATELVNEETVKNLNYIGIDIHETLPDFFPRIPQLQNCGTLIRSSIMDPVPLKDEYDYCLCRAALHHTPNPPVAFAHLCDKLKVGGKIAISVYNKKSPGREACDDMFRKLIAPLSPESAFGVSREFTLLGQALQQVQEKVTIPEDLNVIGIKAGKYKVQELIYYNLLKCFYNEEFGEKYSTLVNYDWYHPEFAFRYTIDEVLKWFSDNDIKVEKQVSIAVQHFIVGTKR